MSTSDHVIKEKLVGMASFKLGLPDMVVGVDEARGNDFIRTIDNFDVGWGWDFRLDLRNLVPFYEDICFKSLDMVMGIMD
jgi:hypothetical protein